MKPKLEKIYVEDNKIVKCSSEKINVDGEWVSKESLIKLIEDYGVDEIWDDCLMDILKQTRGAK